jgi:Cu+-exporting ATPase
MKQPIQTIQFPIEGMTCASCVNRIERHLRKTDGVLSANVNLATETASVKYDPACANPEILANAVKAAGYEPHLPSEVPLRQKTRQLPAYFSLLVAALFTIPLLAALAAETAAPGLPSFLTNPWLELVWATPVQFYAGREFYRGAYRALRGRSADMDTLVALGTSVAYFYSLAAVLAPGFFVKSPAMPPLYFDTAAVIITLILFGRFLEARARHQTTAALTKLLALAPRTARVLRAEAEIDIQISEVLVGDLVRVRPGEKVPVDGLVREGTCELDESMLTGESLPVVKNPGDSVYAGTLSLTGSFLFVAREVGAQTVLAQIGRLVAEAQGSKAPIQRLADVITGYFVPLVLGIAAFTFGGWWLFGPSGQEAILHTVAVLVVACPCALGLATPTSIMVGTGRGANLGLLFRDAESLERLEKIKTLVLDKTGTLTEGRLALTDIYCADRTYTNATLLALAASAEQGSEHPVGRALVSYAQAQGLVLSAVSNFQAYVGQGIRAEVGGRQVYVGRLPANFGSTDLLAQARSFAMAGKSPIFIIADDRPIGLFAFADTLKANAVAVVTELQKSGLEIVILSGDQTVTVATIAKGLGLSRFFAELSPAQKAAKIGELHRADGPVAMVGDGVNDAPALAAADLGIALGTGTDVAMAAGGLTLINGNLGGLLTARALSHATMRNIRQNLGWAFGYNLLLLPLAAGVFYPFFGWTLNPMLAAAAMALSSVTVVSNALRLRAFRAPRLANSGL